MPPDRNKTTKLKALKSVIGLSPTRVAKMPGKSNKFDYSNRSNSGPKLGQIIGSAFEKEADKVKKDAERHLAKARKQSTDSGVDFDQGGATRHIIDLKVPGKQLGDDGVCAMADGIRSALDKGDSSAALALEDVDLSGNGLTTACLKHLTIIINSARHDLKTLNLSGNDIKVESEEQAREWESFLEVFIRCYRLRRLDLSNNTSLGSKAMEILARVHANEPEIDPSAPGGDESVLSLPEASDSDDEDNRSGCASIHLSDKMIRGTILKRRRGLRSLPYITLHNVRLNDIGALWLSYVVEDHHYPSQLISDLNATNAESAIKAYQQDTASLGVDWRLNLDTIGKEGSHLLEKTEVLRRHKMLDDAVTLSGSVDFEDEDCVRIDDARRRSGSMTSHPRSRAGSRRVSDIRSIRTGDVGEHEATELESARKRLQRHIIGHEGVRSVDLWHSAIQVFRASRLIFFIAPATRRYYTGEPTWPTNVPATPTVQPPTPNDSPIPDNSLKLALDEPVGRKDSGSCSKATYASKLQRKCQPDDVLTDVTNTPLTPLRLQRTSHRKGAFSEGTEFNTKLANLSVRDTNRFHFIRYQQDRIATEAAQGRTFRDRSIRSQLPRDVLRGMLPYFLTKRELEVVSERQINAAISRGQRRETLVVEREWVRKEESAQVLMLLDGIGCLAYGV